MYWVHLHVLPVYEVVSRLASASIVSGDGANFGNRHVVGVRKCLYNLQFAIQFLFCAIFFQPANALHPDYHPRFADRADEGSARVALIPCSTASVVRYLEYSLVHGLLSFSRESATAFQSNLLPAVGGWANSSTQGSGAS
jgi:hypothetical protein